MTNESALARMAELLDTVQVGMKSLEQMQQQRAQLTATATVADGRVTVSINADFVVIDVRFTGDIHTLGYPGLADAVKAAAQQAAAEMRCKTAALVQPLQQHNPLVPNLSELAPGSADVFDLIPEPPPATMEPPRVQPEPAPEHQHSRVVDRQPATAMQFENIEQRYEPRPRSRSRVDDG